jgi:hypothetical protein
MIIRFLLIIQLPVIAVLVSLICTIDIFIFIGSGKFTLTEKLEARIDKMLVQHLF